MDERTHIAAMALQGLLSNPNQPINVWDPGLADVAAAYADDLLRHLNGEPRPKHSGLPGHREPRTSALPGTQEPAQTPVRPTAVVSPNLRDLGVSGRACAPLERMGVETLAQLAVQSRKDISGVRGVSVESLKQFDELLAAHGLTWDWTPNDSAGDEEPEEEDNLL